MVKEDHNNEIYRTGLLKKLIEFNCHIQSSKGKKIFKMRIKIKRT